MYIYSTISADVNYSVESGDKILIAGKANVANRNIITPRGTMTRVTDEQIALLKRNHVFQKHLENGFLTIESKKGEADKVASNMTPRDTSAPDTGNDMLMDDDIEEVKGTTIKRKQKK